MADVTLRMFAGAREAAGEGSAPFSGATVGEVLQQASERYGAAFGDVLAASRVWVNGDAAEFGHVLSAGDEIAVLPPVSGG